MLVIVFMLIVQAHCAFFELNGGDVKCFLEETPRDTLILGKHKLEDLNPPQVYGLNVPTLGVTVQVYDPDLTVILERTMPADGKFAFTTQVGGEHKLCFSTNSSRWFGPPVRTKLELEIETGVGATDYEEIAKVEHLSALEVSVRRLNDRVQSIRREQTYQKQREVVFRNTSESTNARVWWWGAAQLSALVGMGLWQMRHIKSFFKAKKLV